MVTNVLTESTFCVLTTNNADRTTLELVLDGSHGTLGANPYLRPVFAVPMVRGKSTRLAHCSCAITSDAAGRTEAIWTMVVAYEDPWGRDMRHFQR